MRYRTLAGLWLASISVAGIGWSVTPHEFHHQVGPLVSPPSDEDGSGGGFRSDFVLSDSPLANAAPFRADRTPARWAYGVPREQPPPARESSPARPMWKLTGILRSRPPVVVFELTDGSDGSKIVSVGETEEGYLIRSVRGDTAFVARDGEEWIFVLENPWG